MTLLQLQVGLCVVRSYLVGAQGYHYLGCSIVGRSYWGSEAPSSLTAALVNTPGCKRHETVQGHVFPG